MKSKKKLDLNMSIADVFSGIDARVNLRHVLSHTSGYHNYFGRPEIEKGLPRHEILRRLTFKEIDTKPGDVFSYSGICFSLLEPVVEKVTKKSFSKSLTQFLKQVGAKSVVVGKLTQTKNYAFPHRLHKNKKDKTIIHTLEKLPVRPYYPITVASSAGVYISLNDAIEILKLITGYKPHVLTRDEIKPYCKGQIIAKDMYNWHLEDIRYPNAAHSLSDLNAHYALGWRTLSDKRGKTPKIIGHSGRMNGSKSFIGFVAELDLAVFIVTNQSGKNMFKTGAYFLAEALNTSQNKG